MDIQQEDLSNLGQLATMQLQCESRIKELENALAEATEEHKRLSMEIIPEKMFEAGLSSFKLSTGETLSIKSGITANIRPENKPQAFGWFIQKGLGAIIKHQFVIEYGKGEAEKAEKAREVLENHALRYKEVESVHHQTLNKQVKELIEEGETLPDAINVFEWQKTIIK